MSLNLSLQGMFYGNAQSIVAFVKNLLKTLMHASLAGHTSF